MKTGTSQLANTKGPASLADPIFIYKQAIESIGGLVGSQST